MSLAKLAGVMETYRGHDQTLALFGYGSRMFAGLLKEDSALAKKLLTISSQISNCRTILRFLDDFSMLDYTISYGLGKHERNFVVRVLNVLNNVVSQIYYPTEHIAWLADNKILKIKSDKFWTVSTLTWLISSVATIICTIIALRKKDADDSSEEKVKIKRLRIKIAKMRLKMYLVLIKELCFAILAIHWLPPGYLWSTKLSNFVVGFLGTLAISSNLLRTNI